MDRGAVAGTVGIPVGSAVGTALSALVRRDGMALARAEMAAKAARARALAIAPPVGDRLLLTARAAAGGQEQARGMFGSVQDRMQALWSEARFWLGIGATEARDWVERSVVVPLALWRGQNERKLEFTDGGGQRAQATVESVGVIDGKQTFEVRYGANRFQVEVPEGIDADETMKRILNFFSQVPAHLRGSLKVVSINAGHNPLDPYNERKYGIEGFTSAATAGNGVISFWNGLGNLRKGTFNHEMGHLIGRAIHDRDTDALGDFINIFQQMAAPHDWQDVARRDGKTVSDYARTNPDEDFAEHWAAYVEAREKGPEAVAEFAREYPNRAAFLQAVFEGPKAR